MTLKEYLAKPDQTVAAFAYKLGVTPEAVRMWLRGDRKPKFKHLMAISEITGGSVKANDFISEPPAE